MRVTIDLSSERIKALAEIGRKENKPQSVLIREAVQTYLNAHDSAETPQAFGLWSTYDVDAFAFEQEIRNEWNDI